MFAVLVKVKEPAGMAGLIGTSGVTVTVATKGVLPGFWAINEGILPVPLAASPMAGVLFVQLNTTPAGVPVKFTGAVGVLITDDIIVAGIVVGDDASGNIYKKMMLIAEEHITNRKINNN